jgi:glycosyltransferase involved in cell wall biosynthesis
MFRSRWNRGMLAHVPVPSPDQVRGQAFAGTCTDARRRNAMTGLISVITTTYDREDALDAVLRGLSRQGDRHFEVVIADDGSGPATARLIEQWTSRLGVPLEHVWQEHRGFRAAEVRNRAIGQSRGNYCIFLDGDCIPRADFIATHRALAEPGWFVAGNRILLSRALTESVLREGLAPETWGLATFAGQRLRRNVNRLMPLLSLPLGPWRKMKAREWRGCRSCNLAVWRADLARVDGFDAAYTGWGKEDSDLVVRLLHAGVARKDGRFATGVLHLWHPQADRSDLPQNEARLGKILDSDHVRADRGLSRLDAECLRVADAAPRPGRNRDSS